MLHLRRMWITINLPGHLHFQQLSLPTATGCTPWEALCPSSMTLINPILPSFTINNNMRYATIKHTQTLILAYQHLNNTLLLTRLHLVFVLHFAQLTLDVPSPDYHAHSPCAGWAGSNQHIPANRIKVGSYGNCDSVGVCRARHGWVKEKTIRKEDRSAWVPKPPNHQVLAMRAWPQACLNWPHLRQQSAHRQHYAGRSQLRRVRKL